MRVVSHSVTHKIVEMIETSLKYRVQTDNSPGVSRTDIHDRNVVELPIAHRSVLLQVSKFYWKDRNVVKLSTLQEFLSQSVSAA